MRLVFVHGRDQQGQSSESIKAVWKRALDLGLAEAKLASVDSHEIRLPYYGDALNDIVCNIRLAAANGIVTKGSPPSGTYMETFQTELLLELLPSDFQSELESDLPIQKGFQNTSVARLLARVADDSPWGNDLLSLLTEDVAIYLNNSTAAKQINAIVEAAIPKNEPSVVVGHSLGSIVAYRVLQELGENAHVTRFITLGSPLGLNTVRNILRPLSVPRSVRSWLNVYDPRDIVSLRPLDESTWNVSPKITNIKSETNHTPNRHGISGYLDNTDVVREIFAGLNDVIG